MESGVGESWGEDSQDLTLVKPGLGLAPKVSKAHRYLSSLGIDRHRPAGVITELTDS